MLLLCLLSPLIGLAGLLYMERVERRLTASITEQQHNTRNRRSVSTRPAIRVEARAPGGAPAPVGAPHHLRGGRPAVRLSPTQARRSLAQVASASRSSLTARRTQRRVSRRALAATASERTAH